LATRRGQEDAAIDLIEFDLFGVRLAESITASFFVIFFLYCLSVVIDKPARTDETAHIAFLLIVKGRKSFLAYST
jgi:hypothetical protein